MDLGPYLREKVSSVVCEQSLWRNDSIVEAKSVLKKEGE